MNNCNENILEIRELQNTVMILIIVYIRSLITLCSFMALFSVLAIVFIC